MARICTVDRLPVVQNSTPENYVILHENDPSVDQIVDQIKTPFIQYHIGTRCSYDRK